MTQQNTSTSKFAIFLEYKTPYIFFPFSLINTLVCCHRLGHSWKKNSVARNQKWNKKLCWFSYSKSMATNIEAIEPGHFIKHKPLISEEWHKHESQRQHRFRSFLFDLHIIYPPSTSMTKHISILISWQKCWCTC